MVNYRKEYENYFGIKIPKEYDIHHIDMNRNNNELENLLLVPKKLHNDYHTIMLIIKGGNIKLDLELKSTIDKGNCNNSYIREKVFQYVSIYYEMQKWVDYKLYLKNELPNIHNIDLKGE